MKRPIEVIQELATESENSKQPLDEWVEYLYSLREELDTWTQRAESELLEKLNIRND